MIELKPCPFCGGNASIKKVAYSYGMDGSYYEWHIGCTRCSANIEIAADNFYGRKSYTEEEAAAKWNRRVFDDSLSPKGEER